MGVVIREAFRTPSVCRLFILHAQRVEERRHDLTEVRALSLSAAAWATAFRPKVAVTEVSTSVKGGGGRRGCRNWRRLVASPRSYWAALCGAVRRDAASCRTRKGRRKRSGRSLNFNRERGNPSRDSKELLLGEELEQRGARDRTCEFIRVLFRRMYPQFGSLASRDSRAAPAARDVAALCRRAARELHLNLAATSVHQRRHGHDQGLRGYFQGALWQGSLVLA